MKPIFKGIPIFQLIFIINTLVLENNIKAQCVINITDGILGNYNVRTNYLNCTINVNTRLSLRGNITFKDCVFNMDANAEINMHKPYQSFGLRRNNVVLFDHCKFGGSSSTKWKGINVASGSYLSVINSSEIEDALIGINGAYQSNCRIIGTSFSSCNIGLNFPNLDSRFNSGTFAAINLNDFSGNKFRNLPIGIKVNGIIKLDIGLNASNINEFEGGGTGILVLNSNTSIYNCRFYFGDYQIDIVNNLPNSQLNMRTCNILGLGQSSVATFSYAQEKSVRVFGNWQTVNIGNAKFENRPHNQSIDIESLNNGTFNIENNIFKVVGQSGIFGSTIYIRNSSDFSNSRISFNTFLEPFEGNLNFAIQLVNLKPTKLDVQYNKLYGSDILDMGQNKIGETASPKTFCSFHAENCSNVYFSANSLKLGGNASNNSPWVIHHMSGSSCDFRANLVTNETFTSNRQSIRLEGLVERDILCSNTVKNSYRGIIIENNSPGTKIQNNKIIGDGTVTNNQIGILVNGNVPVQRHEGNNWMGSNFQREAFIKPSLIINDRQNLFISRDDNYGLSDKYWPTSVNVPNWFKDDKSINAPNNCNILFIPSLCTDYDENRYLSDSAYRSNLSPGELWDSDSYFFKYYSDNLSCLISQDQIQLYDSLNNSNLPDFIFIENRVKEFYKIDANTQGFIFNHKNYMDSIVLELSTLYSGIFPEDTIDVDSMHQSEINDLEDLLEGLAYEMDSTLRFVDSLRSIEIGNLFSFVQNLDCANSYDSLLKVYYFLLVKKIGNDTLSELEYEVLYDISRLCPSLYGNLAYLANSILPMDIHLENLAENCAEPILSDNEINSKRHGVDCEISLYPNPALSNSEIVLNFNCLMESVKLFDIFGNELALLRYGKTISVNMSTLKIDCTNLVSGIYFVVFDLVDGSRVQKKLFLH